MLPKSFVVVGRLANKRERKREREDGRCVVVVVAVVDSVVPRSLVVLDFRPNQIPFRPSIKFPTDSIPAFSLFVCFYNPERSYPEVSLSFFLELAVVCFFLTPVFFFVVVVSSVLAVVFFSAALAADKERVVGGADADNDGSSTTPGATMMTPKAKAPAPNQAYVSVNEYKSERENEREIMRLRDECTVLYLNG
jgi:hypothetical protein